MSAPWFYCRKIVDGVVELDERERRHALTVLRLEPPATITLFDGCGRVALAKLRASDVAGRRRKDVAVDVAVEHIEEHARPTPALTLVVAACKGPRLDTLVEKCSELGVDRLVLTGFERSVVQLESRHADKLRDTAIAACKQSRNPWLPTIESGLPLVAALERCCDAALVAAHLDLGATSIADVVRGLVHARSSATVVVGPEGGLAQREIDILSSRGARFVRLAEQVLRVETAALAVAANWSAARVSGASA